MGPNIQRRDQGMLIRINKQKSINRESQSRQSHFKKTDLKQSNRT